MTEFALQRFDILHNSYKEWKSEDHHHAELDYIRKIDSYARFVRQPLTLGMFVPVDEEGKVLEKPKNYDIAEPIIKSHLNHKAGKKKEDEHKFHVYKEAKEKVLFEGFEVCYHGHSIIRIEFNSEDGFPEYSFDIKTGKCNQHKTIEELCSKELPLTAYALKQIGL